MVQILDRPSSGELFGTALGQGLQALTQMKLKEYVQRQQENKFATGLEALGYTKEQAQALAPLMSPYSMGAAPNRSYGTGTSQRNVINRLIDYRKSLGGAKSGGIAKQLQKKGIGDNIIGSINKGKITDEMIDFLLQQTGNDPKKAKLIAEKLGFKV